MSIKKLEKYLYTHIPISQAMGVHVVHASSESVALSAPFINNINHQKTVFGGSLHAVATLACWCLLYNNLIDEQVQIVIAQSKMDYLAPVDGNFHAECLRPTGPGWQRFIKMLHLKGKARIHLSATIYHRNRLCVDYNATFAAIRNN